MTRKLIFYRLCALTFHLNRRGRFSLRGRVVIKGRRPLNFDVDGEETDDDSEDEGAPSVSVSEESKVRPSEDKTKEIC